MTPLLKSLSWIFGHLPMRVVLAAGRGLGAVSCLFARRKHEVLSRIQDCLGVDEPEARRIRRGMYENLGMTAVEVLRQPHMRDEEVRRRMHVEGGEKLPEKGPVLLLVAHTGNWELLAASAPLLSGMPLHVVVKKLKPASLDAWMLCTRTKWGTRILDRRGSVREILRVMRDGEFLGFILDQNAKRNWGVFVDFFGKPACTSDGLSEVAARAGAPTYPVFCRRLPDHDLLISVGDPIPAPQARSPEAIQAHTQRCTAEIEAFVRLYPEQWIWMHRRWRTQPEVSA